MSAQGWEMHSACCPPPIIQPPTPQSAEGGFTCQPGERGNTCREVSALTGGARS